MENVDNLEEFYKKSSSVTYFGGIKVPMIFINSLDDPIIPMPLINVVRDAVSKF